MISRKLCAANTATAFVVHAAVASAPATHALASLVTPVCGFLLMVPPVWEALILPN